MDQNASLAKFNSIIRTLGYIFVTIALVCDFVPAIYASITTGIFPGVGDLLGLWVAAASAFGIGWFVQPVSFFPMTNMLVHLCAGFAVMLAKFVFLPLQWPKM